MSRPAGRRLAAFVPLALLAVPAAFAAQRTFVSTSGQDTNACSLAAPCRGFAQALGATDAGGEIVVLDSGGYGAVAIGKAVSIVAPPGIYAGISVFPGGATNGQGVVVNAGSGKVVLRGLTITGLGGTDGIAFNSGDALYIDNVVVTGFGTGSGLTAAIGAATAGLFVQDSAFRDNATGLKTTTAGGALTINIERSSFVRNGKGADIQGATKGVIHSGIFSGGTTGVSAGFAGSPATVKLELKDCTVADNSGAGIAAVTSSATMLSLITSLVSGNQFGLQVVNGSNLAYVSDSTITRNVTGVSASAGASVASGVDNRLVNNTTNGAFSTSVPKL